MFRKAIILLTVLTLFSCGRRTPGSGERIITVSIAPLGYFVREIGGDDFTVNVMVPPGANPHIYEPYPEQISRLLRSSAYVSNGYIGFEMTWLDRFYEINRSMARMSAGERINPIAGSHEHEHNESHEERADPHYWISPKCAGSIAASVRDLLCSLNPSATEKYASNYSSLIRKIDETDARADSLFSGFTGEAFMIYHPNLAYLARDYGLMEMPVEFEGKEPPPSRLAELIDLARKSNMKVIFVQKEYDTRNARAIAQEIGAEVVVIDPLSNDWFSSVNHIIDELHRSFIEKRK